MEDKQHKLWNQRYLFSQCDRGHSEQEGKQMSDIKRIVSWKLVMDIEWEDGKKEEIDFPEHLAQSVDDYLTEIEEERAEEDNDE